MLRVGAGVAREGLSETLLQSFGICQACAAPKGLGGSREYVPTASAVGYGVSSLAGLGGEAMRAATGVRGDVILHRDLAVMQRALGWTSR